MDHSQTNVDPNAIPAQDPDHDIDATKTIISLVVSTAFVFGSMIVMYVFFNQTIHSERYVKIDQSPTVQRDELREYEAMQLGAGEGRKSIDDSIENYATR